MLVIQDADADVSRDRIGLLLVAQAAVTVVA
jgi:hypothetical protein